MGRKESNQTNTTENIFAEIRYVHHKKEHLFFASMF